MKRGSLYWVNLEPSSPPEFGKKRPCVIVSNTVQNHHLPTVVVIPLSTQPGEIWPLRIELKIPSIGKKSFAVIPGLRQIKKTRLLQEIGTLSSIHLEELTKAMNAYLED